MSTANSFVDCSSNNPIPNVAAYKTAGHKTLCRKVTEGVGYHWFEGDAVADACHKAGLTVGHYHWLRPDSSATAQAAFFVTSVKPHLKLGDWLMTDFERTQGASDPGDVTRAAQLHEFNVYVAQHLPGYPLYVYTGNWYLDGKPHCQAECRRWPIVMSNYSDTATLPNPYGLHYVAWQFTDAARVAGFRSAVDYNRWLVTPSPAPAPTAAPPIRKRPDMLVVHVDPTTVPSGKTAPASWLLLHGDKLTRIPSPAGKPLVNNGTNVLAGLGQAHVCPITYDFYVKLGGV